MKIDKKLVVVSCLVVVALALVLLIKPKTNSDTNKTSGDIKIVASEASNLVLEDFENNELTMKKPKDWVVTTAGEGMYYAISIYDKNNTANKIFLMLKIQPLLKSEAGKKSWQDYASMSSNPDIYKPFTASVVLNNPTVKEFYTKFNDITSFLKNVDSSYNNVLFPVINNLNIIEEVNFNSSFKNIALDDKIIRVTFNDENNKESEGMFSASIVNFGDNNMGGVDMSYYMIYNIMAITTSKDDFIDYKDILLDSINSINFKDSYVQKTIDDGNAQTKRALELSAQMQQAHDSYMAAWENRNKTYDIMSQKQSDATLGYERVYDTDTGEIYKAYNGFTDDYDGNKYKSITDDMYTEKTSGYIEK